ncbi:multiubiquitin domain-containing protein [Geothrix alkalitolerans]|uniref:multiubiquitin domain-containing protein n=1 Tax=Geothrix alkalitolerans TaxID=2922724 RepID=UPI001FAEE3D3|nr:multiubiquitin domain-containing protein [Geothrix alkalitolerans]
MHQVHSIHVFINKKKFELDDPVQLGASLKQLANIPDGDVLFLQREGGDDVIGNDVRVTLKNGDHLHSQPAADYGLQHSKVVEEHLAAHEFSLHEGPEGWSFLVIADYSLPSGFRPDKVQLLVKLPPTYPDAAPDMFWVHPEVQTPNGTVPRSTSSERILEKDWQRFSWHLANGAWKPGVSDLGDYLRCVRARFLRLD